MNVVTAFIRLPILLLIAFTPLAHADIYKTVDADGHVTYSNIPNKGASKLDIEGSFNGNNTGTKAAPSKTSKTPTPSNFPRVDSQTQSSRDGKRKQILQDELDTEQKALADAKKRLSDSVLQQAKDPNSKSDGKLLDIQSEVESHDKNIKLLQKELGNLKWDLWTNRRTQPISGKTWDKEKWWNTRVYVV